MLDRGGEADRVRFLTMGLRCRTRGNGPNAETHEITLDCKERLFFTVRMTEHGKRFPGETVESPFLETEQTCLDMALGNILEGTSLEQEART